MSLKKTSEVIEGAIDSAEVQRKYVERIQKINRMLGPTLAGKAGDINSYCDMLLGSIEAMEKNLKGIA